MRRVLGFIFTIIFLVAAGYSIFVIIDNNNKNIYKKLWKVYSKDSTYSCNVVKVCTKKEVVEISDEKYNISRKIDFKNESYEIKITKGNIKYTGSYAYNDLEGAIELIFTLSTSYGEYIGKYDLETSKVYGISNINLNATDNAYNMAYEDAKTYSQIMVDLINEDLK